VNVKNQIFAVHVKKDMFFKMKNVFPSVTRTTIALHAANHKYVKTVKKIIISTKSITNVSQTVS